MYNFSGENERFQRTLPQKRHSIVKSKDWKSWKVDLWNIFITLPNDKILDQSKLKAFADDKIYVTQKLKFVIEWVKTVWEKEKMPVTSIFFFSHIFFKSFSFQGR